MANLKKLKQRAQQYKPGIKDNCDISTLKDGFARAVLAPSKYGELVYQMDDFEFSLWLKEHNLHTDIDLIQFAIENTEFSINAIL